MHAKQILLEMKQQKEIASRDITHFDSQVQAAHAVAIGQAKERLSVLESWYKNYINGILQPVFVVSSIYNDKHAEQKLVEQVSEKYKTNFVYSFNEPYKYLAKETWKFFAPTGEYGTNQHQAFSDILRALALDLGVLQMEFPQFNTGFFVNSVEELQVYLKREMVRVVGEEFAILYFRKHFPERALEIQLSQFDLNADDSVFQKMSMIIKDISDEEMANFIRVFSVNSPVIERLSHEISKEKTESSSVEMQATEKTEKRKPTKHV